MFCHSNLSTLRQPGQGKRLCPEPEAELQGGKSIAVSMAGDQGGLLCLISVQLLPTGYLQFLYNSELLHLSVPPRVLPVSGDVREKVAEFASPRPLKGRRGALASGEWALGSFAFAGQTGTPLQHCRVCPKPSCKSSLWTDLFLAACSC